MTKYRLMLNLHLTQKLDCYQSANLLKSNYLLASQQFCLFLTSSKEEPNDLKFLLERSLVQEIVDRLVRSGIKRISDVLDRAEIKPPQVGLCLATGGMVNMPIICSRLYELFGASQVEFFL